MNLRWLITFLAVGLGGVPGAAAQEDHGFRFVRIRYEDPRGTRWGDAPWSHDWPTAEQHLYEALRRTTNIRVAPGESLVLTLKDEEIFKYPILYLCEPGFWEMEEEEVENLREYLNRGGFLLFDDFRGFREWTQLEMQMQRVFPDREFVEVMPEHPIWSVYYDVDPVAAPSLVSGGRFPSDADRYMALFDDDGRMMALACYNQDLGDGWEWPDRWFGDGSTISFQMGLNFVIYALTH